MKKSVLVLVGLSLLVGMVQAKTHKVDISPAILTNLAEGHSGAVMGAAISADYYLSGWSAFRTTVGFTKERYFPSELNYRDANYGFWLSAAPMVQANFGDIIRPYIALLGTISGVGRRFDNTLPLAGVELSPYRTMATNPQHEHTLLSLGASIGSKFRVYGPVSIFAEFSHYLYSNVSTADNYFPGSIAAFGRPLDFERNPTYMSIGMTYSLRIGKSAER